MIIFANICNPHKVFCILSVNNSTLITLYNHRWGKGEEEEEEEQKHILNATSANDITEKCH